MVHYKWFSIRTWVDQKLRSRLEQAAEQDYTNSHAPQNPQIRADAEVWAEMDIGQEHKQDPWDEGVAKAGNWPVKKQAKRRVVSKHEA